MKNPNRLRVIPHAEDLAVEVYRITRNFPRDERFGLVSQMRRAAVSIGSNVSEGCGLNTDRAFIASVHRALGETYELDFQRRVAVRLEFGNPEELIMCGSLITAMSKQLTRLIVSHRSLV
jgi:four helix bundle protein